jgi:hypothetical protein
MKTLVYFLFVAIFFAVCEKSNGRSTDGDVTSAQLLSAHTVVSQTPAISRVYTDEQINSMIESYHAAPDRDVIAPEAISRVFAGHFPNARDIDWEVSNNIYKVDFDIWVTDYEAWYDASGNLLMYIFDVRVSSLPAVVKNAVNQKYPKFKIDDAEKFYQGSVAGYKVKVEKGKIEYEAWFREDGTFIRERLD